MKFSASKNEAKIIKTEAKIGQRWSKNFEPLFHEWQELGVPFGCI